MASEQRCMQWHTVQVLHLGSISLAPQGSKVLCWVSSLSALSPKGHANCFMGAKEAQWSRFLFLFVFVSNVLSFRDQYLHQGGGIRFFFFCFHRMLLGVVQRIVWAHNYCQSNAPKGNSILTLWMATGTLLAGDECSHPHAQGNPQIRTRTCDSRWV